MNNFDDVFWDGVMLSINGNKVFVASLEDPDIAEICVSKIEEITNSLKRKNCFDES